MIAYYNIGNQYILSETGNWSLVTNPKEALNWRGEN